jgi:hypothetical protein
MFFRQLEIGSIPIQINLELAKYEDLICVQEIQLWILQESMLTSIKIINCLCTG